jgi:membrane-associated PAP2 superfamily phosphatase
VLIIALGLGLLALATGPARWRERWALRRRDVCVALAVLASAPALISAVKATTNTFCPYEIRRYSGSAPYVRVLETYPVGDRPTRRGRGFPAGHASGGFALLGLAGLARKRRGQIAGVCVGHAAGWAMGGYQMLRGAHYFSHTVITMLVCWIIFLLWRRTVRVADHAGVSA